MTLAIGETVGRRYEITGFLGAGGMGIVYTALDRRLDRHVALKVVKSDSETPDAIERFVLEWRAMARVEHENILRLYDADRDGAQWFFTAELLSGTTLAAHLHERKRLHWRDAVDIGIALARALRCVHDHRIVHRDVKPENVFITKDRRIKLLDFGIAKELPEPGTDAGAVKTGGGFCTPAFASPEQLARREIDARSDIFSFGILMYLLVAGEHPFEHMWPKILNNNPAPSLAPNLAPHELAVLLDRCLQKAAHLRFSSIDEVEDALVAVRAGGTVEDLDIASALPVDSSAFLRRLEEHLVPWNRSVLQDRTYAPFMPECRLLRRSVVSRIESFLESDKVFMVLGGKAGTGKSFLIAGLPETLPSKTLLWIFDCGTMPWPWESNIAELLVGAMEPQASLDDLTSALESTDRQMLVVFDGLNESARRGDFAARVSDFVRVLTSARLKVLVTCRLPAWHALRRSIRVPLDRYFQAGINGYVELDAFNTGEAEQAFALYKRAYSIETSYEQLAAAVRHFLAHPLFLKLTCEAFEGRVIPPVVALHEVFAAYIRKCLGGDPAKTQDWTLLEHIVRVMYEAARREIEVNVLRHDAAIGADIARGEGSSYSHLLDESLLTEAIRNETLLRTTEIVFVTYERVFEFLLAEVVIGSVTAERIALHLDVIRDRSFPQLRGALELALSFALVRGTATPALLIQLAQVDRPDSRQFLADVIHTVYDSGHRQLATSILSALSRDKSLEPQLLAAQVAYQLGFDDRLLDILVSGQPTLRDRAALLLYASWNRKRLAGDLEGAYRPLRELRNRVSILHLPRSRAAVSALTTLCLNLGLHIIDDERALYPLIDLLRDFVRNLPGLAPDAGKRSIARFASNKTGDLLIDVLGSVLSRVMIKDRVLAGIFDDNRTKRALLDVGHLITLGDLRLHEEKVRRLISWNHPAVAFSSRSVLTRHVFISPDVHLPMFESFLESEELSPMVRVNVLHAMVYGVVARCLKTPTEASVVLRLLEDWFEELWPQLLHTDGLAAHMGDLTADDRMKAAQYVLFGLLFIDALRQRQSGRFAGSNFVTRFSEAGTNDRRTRLVVALKAVESMAFQGFVEYAVATLLEPTFRAVWTADAPDTGRDTLASLRSLFQEEVDGMFHDAPESWSLWEEVRANGGTPDPGVIWEMSYEVWTMVATAVNVTLMKLSGLLLLDLVRSRRPSEFLRTALRTFIGVLFEPERIDIAHVQYGLAHDPRWNLYDALEIQRDVLTLKPELHEHYRRIMTDCVASLGRGMMYNEL